MAVAQAKSESDKVFINGVRQKKLTMESVSLEGGTAGVVLKDPMGVHHLRHKFMTRAPFKLDVITEGGSSPAR